MSHNHHDVEKTIKRYKAVGITLIVFTAITVLVSYASFKVAIGIAVALLIATFKGSLVVAYFMHLTEEKPLILWILLLAVAFFFVLLLMPTWWASDAFIVK